MGLDPKLLPDSFRRRMATPERKAMTLPTMGEAEDAKATKSERKLHDQFENWCRVKGIFVIHSRTDRKSTNRVGLPDFVLIYGAKVIGVEFKIAPNMASDEQNKCMTEMQAVGCQCAVCFDLQSAIWFCGEKFGC